MVTKMDSSESKILYSFRRCPYAMRARLAVASSEMPVELREVVLRDKPDQMLEASPKGTVPVLVLSPDNVLEESLDIIDWALSRSDPEGLLAFDEDEVQEMRILVEQNDGPFKNALDRYKYPNRFDDIAANEHRQLASAFIKELDTKLEGNRFLFGDRISFADVAILPFVRQFAFIDKAWFDAQDWPNVQAWLERFLNSPSFASIMSKYPQWQPGAQDILFPDAVNHIDDARRPA